MPGSFLVGLLALQLLAAEPSVFRQAMEKAIAQGKLLEPAGENAWDSYQQLLKSSTDAREKEQARTALAAALENAGQRSIAAYMQSHEPTPGEAFSSAETSSQAEEFRRAAQMFGRALELRPRHGKLLAKQRFCEGRALLVEGHFVEAWPLLQESLALEPTAYAYNALGVVHLNRHVWNEAVRSLQQAAQRAPRWVYPHHNLGLAYLELRRFQDAEREWVLTSVLAPERAFPYINLGVLYLKMGRSADAERQFRYAAHLHPEDPATYHNLGLVFQLENRLAEAEVQYRKAIAADPKNVSSRVNLAGLYLALGRVDEAEQELRQALEIDPRNTQAREALEELLNYHKKAARP